MTDQSTDQSTEIPPDPQILDFSDPQSEYEKLMARMEAAEAVIFAYEDREWAMSSAQKVKLKEKITAARAAWGQARANHAGDL